MRISETANRTFGVFVLLLLLIACQVDHGLQPIRTRIEGRVIFQGPPPPPYVAEARVVATKRFPPQNLTSDVLFSDRLTFDPQKPAGSLDSVAYRLTAEPRRYPAVGVLWRRSGSTWEITNILGLYTDPLAFTPREVVIDEAHPVAADVDILANWELAYRDAVIEGDLYFRGQWPEDTEILALGVFPIIPRTQLEFLTVQALDIAIPLFRGDPYHYRTAVAGGTFKFIAVFWKGKSTSIFDIRAVGFHACAGDSLQPRAVSVASGETRSGIDIVVDFSTLPAGCRTKRKRGLARVNPIRHGEMKGNASWR